MRMQIPLKNRNGPDDNDQDVKDEEDEVVG